jgi:catechol 2,3-dioxygenase-like lactoylglutathione lyase family enzyme
VTGPPIAGLDHLVLHVADGAVAAAFYRDVLGARVEELPYGRLRFRIGDAVLNVHQPTSTPHPRAARPGGPGSGDLCFAYAGSAEEALAHLAARDVEAIEGPVERDGARGVGRSVYFRDPDGTLLELISYA